VENTTMRSFAQHLDELNLQDCDRLSKIVNKHLARRDVQFDILAKERDIYVRTFRNHRSDALGLCNVLEPGPNAAKSEREDFLAIREMLRQNPEEGPKLMDRIVDLVNVQLDATLTEIKRPVWERDYPTSQDHTTPAARLLFVFCPRSYARFGDRFASERTLL